MEPTTKLQHLPPQLTTKVASLLFSTLNQGGAKTLFVGGCVRAAVLGHFVDDIDLATTLHPEEAALLLKQAGFTIVPIGLTHGTILAQKGEEKFEITTLRQDLNPDGRHAQVRFSQSFEEDATRRDLTFNALYLSQDGDLYDPFGGIDDLKKGRARFIGSPTLRLQEDWLRALRFIRFYCRYGTTRVSSATKAALKAAAPYLKTLSAERKTQEFLKILAHRHSPKGVALMAELGFFQALGLDFNIKNYKKFITLWPNSTPLQRLASGVWAPQTPEAVRALGQNPHFRFSNAQKAVLQALNPAKLLQLYPNHPRYSAWACGTAGAAAALWQQYATYGASHLPPPLKGKEREIYQNLLDQKTTVPPFSGAELQKQGVPAGKGMGQLLAQLTYLWATEENTEKPQQNLLQHKNTGAYILLAPLTTAMPVVALKKLLHTPAVTGASFVIFACTLSTQKPAVLTLLQQVCLRRLNVLFLPFGEKEFTDALPPAAKKAALFLQQARTLSGFTFTPYSPAAKKHTFGLAPTRENTVCTLPLAGGLLALAAPSSTRIKLHLPQPLCLYATQSAPTPAVF